MRNLQTVQVKTGSSFEKICPFPVGFIYMSSNSTSPADIYGGTWSALTDSRFLQPSGSWNSTGGITSHYHWTTVGRHLGESRTYFSNDGKEFVSRVLSGVTGASQYNQADYSSTGVTIEPVMLGIAPLNLRGVC